MNTNQTKQEYQELKTLIDTIISTAKLLDYKISIDPIFNLTTITKQNNILPFLTISLHQTQQTTKLISQLHGTTSILENETHQNKINQLNTLLQAL